MRYNICFYEKLKCFLFQSNLDNASLEEMKLAQRAGLIQHLPQSTWDEKQVSAKKVRE